MKRREFLKTSAALAAMAGSADLLNARELFAPSAENGAGDVPPASGSLIASAPLLQNFAPDSMGVVFAVSDLANGYVLLSRDAGMAGAKKVKCGGFRTTDIDDRVCRIRLTGLEPDTQYYYRIGADRISYGGGYKMKVIGGEEDPRIYGFRTAGASGEAHFCVINDTHAKWDPFGRAIEKIAAISPSFVIWNGDASNTEETVEAQMRIFLNPEIARKDYGCCTPFLFCPGNHDQRGMANRHLERVWMFRQPEERSSRDWDLGRNFAVRQGDVALIGLDTGEDKLDGNPRFAGLFNNEAYRVAQTAWLRDVLRRKEIKKAPFLVAFCHIPLFDPDPAANPGDLAPADTAPGFKKDYAAWQRSCANMWGPLLSRAGCQLVITGHQHRYRFDEPQSGRTWAQIVGGGPTLDPSKEAALFPTVIEGEVKRGKLEVTVHNLRTGKVQAVHSFSRRKILGHGGFQPGPAVDTE